MTQHSKALDKLIEEVESIMRELEIAASQADDLGQGELGNALDDAMDTIERAIPR